MVPKFSVFTTAYRNFSLSNLTIGVRCYQEQLDLLKIC